MVPSNEWRATVRWLLCRRRTREGLQNRFREFLLIRRLLLSARNGLAMDDRIGQQGGEEVEPPFLHVELHALLGTFSREAT